MTHLSRYSFEPSTRRVAGMTREQACHHLHGRVSAMARHVCGRQGRVGTLTTEDLVSHGMEGLLAAFDHFDPRHGTTFDSYARVRVKGAMIDALRAQDTMSRHGRRKARLVEQARSEAREDGGNNADAAARLGLDLDGFHRAVRDAQPATVLSLDAPLGDGDADDARLIDAIADERVPAPDRGIQLAQALGLLDEAIGALPPRLRECVVLHHLQGVPQTEIARRYGVTVSRVSQLLNTARSRLRAHLAPSVDGEDVV